MGGAEQAFVNEVFATNWIAPLGPMVDGFEQDLAEFTGVKHALALNSGTAAIHLALILLGVKPGDYVICQSLTFSASANPIRYLGATPVFVDSEPETWNMCSNALEQAIVACKNGTIASTDNKQQKPASGNKHTIHRPAGNEPATQQEGCKVPAAIIPVHLYGMPAHIDKIMAIAAKYDVPVIEDAAEALGSHIKGKQCGSYGDFSILSFNGNKIITTSGGGALLSNDEEKIRKARYLATQARDPAPHYQHSEVGYNYRMSNVLAGIGRGQMQVLGERTGQRRANHAFYTDLLGNKKGIAFLQEPRGYFSNRWLTTILVDPKKTGGVSREHIRLALEAENIESRPLWKPMHLQPVFNGYPYVGTGVSDKLFDQGLCLPSGSGLTNHDRTRIAKTLKALLA